MRHAVDNFAHAKLTAIFNDCFKRGDHGFAAIKAETLRAYIFAAKEFLILLGFNDFRENGLLALWRELDGSVLAFHSFLQEPAFFNV